MSEAKVVQGTLIQMIFSNPLTNRVSLSTPLPHGAGSNGASMFHRNKGVFLLRDGDSVGGMEPWMVEYLRDGLSPMHVPGRLAAECDGVLTHTFVQQYIATAIQRIFDAGAGK